MRLPLQIARRYLFARRSTNAVNIITGVAVFGIAIGTAALILILSVFNGFEDLFLSLYNDFNPDITITPKEGKSFVPDSTQLARLRALPAVEVVSETLEERALFDYREQRQIGMLKGVDENYRIVTGIDSTVREGVYELGGEMEAAVVGGGIRNKLGIDIEDPLASLVIYLPKRKKTSVFDTRPFTSRAVRPVGTFLVQQDFEKQYVLADIEVARNLLGRPNAVSSLEVKLAPGFDIPSTYEEVGELMGDTFVIKNRYEQEASFLRLMRIEKWLSYAIVGLMLLLVSFNMIGALWMIVLEKQTDIAILRSMGMTPGGIYQIFLLEGVLMSIVGILLGFAIALLIYWVQVTFGIITLPGGRLVDAYPVSLRWYDFPIVALTVLSIGTLAAILPARRAKRVPAIIREE